MIGLAAVALFVGAIVVAARSGALDHVGEVAPPSVTVHQPGVSLPKVDQPTAIQMQALATGPGIDTALKAFGLWLDERLIWVAVLMLGVGLGLHALHRWRDLGRAVMWSAGLALLGLLVLPLLVALIPPVVSARDQAISGGITISTPRPR